MRKGAAIVIFFFIIALNLIGFVYIPKIMLGLILPQIFIVLALFFAHGRKKTLKITAFTLAIITSVGLYYPLVFLSNRTIMENSIARYYAKYADEYMDLGEYYINNASEKERITWRVVDKKDNKLLLISDKVLDGMAWDTSINKEDYSTSKIRNFLVGEFYQTAFGNIQGIVEPNFEGSSYGNALTDKVFLLSKDEANGLKKSELKAKPTPYAQSKDVYAKEIEDDTPVYWLRSFVVEWGWFGSNRHTSAYFVEINGKFNDSVAAEITAYNGGVRPCVWINLDILFKYGNGGGI